MASNGGASPRPKDPSVGTLGVPNPNPEDGGGPRCNSNNNMWVSICIGAGR